MAKRYTCTEKWESTYFSSLAPDMKLLFLYILDRCDTAGVWKGNWKLASYFTGSTSTVDEMKDALGCVGVLEFTGKEKLVDLEDGKVWVSNFLKFQNPSGLKSNKPMVVGIRKKIREYPDLGGLVRLTFGDEFLPKDGWCETKKGVEPVVLGVVEEAEAPACQPDKTQIEKPKSKTGLKLGYELINEKFPNATDEVVKRICLAFKDYVEMRKKIRSPMTDMSIKRLLNKLEGETESRWVECLHIATDSNWKSVFPENKSVQCKRGVAKPDLHAGQFKENDYVGGVELGL